MQEICIIIPCYNEEHRLPIKEIESYYDKSLTHFCFVNDGSIDKTAQVLQKLQEGKKDRILIIDQKKNCGKAEAVRAGINGVLTWKKFNYVGYFDADLSSPLSEIKLLINFFTPEINFVFGSRIKRIGAVIERSSLRHYFGRIFSTFASIILGLPVYDTQCGAKLIRREIAEEIFKEPFISKWLFDVEIFARMVLIQGKEKMINSTVEVPLRNWVEKGGSKIKFSYLLKIPFELIRIKKIYRSKIK